MRTVTFIKATDVRAEGATVSYDDNSAAYYVENGFAQYIDEDVEPAADLVDTTVDDSVESDAAPIETAEPASTVAEPASTVAEPAVEAAATPAPRSRTFGSRKAEADTPPADSPQGS